VGAGYSWKSSDPKVGSGKVEIIGTNLEDSIQVLLDFMPEVPAKSTFAFVQDEHGLVLNWSIDFEMNKNPFLRYLGLFMDRWIGKDFEEGLIQLESFAIDEAALHPPLRIELKEVSSFAYIYLERKTSFNEISQTLGIAYAELMKQIRNPGIQMTGAPFALYLAYDSLTTTLQAGIPVQPWFKPGAQVKLDTIKKVKALVGYYYGPYSGISSAYERLKKYSQTHNFILDDYTWESYVTDPGTEPDSTKWLTEIYFPIKE
jgi:effector-binding domain-containing protein